MVKTPYEEIVYRSHGIILEGLKGFVEGVLTIAHMLLQPAMADALSARPLQEFREVVIERLPSNELQVVVAAILDKIGRISNALRWSLRANTWHVLELLL